MTTLVVSFVPVVAVSYTGTGIYRQQLAVEELVLVKWQLAIRELVLKNLRPKKGRPEGLPKDVAVLLSLTVYYLQGFRCAFTCRSSNVDHLRTCVYHRLLVKIRFINRLIEC